MKPRPLIIINSITVRLKDKFLFKNTSWEMLENQNWLIIGENGSGKTTFAKALAGLLPLKTGEIILNFLKDKYPYPSVYKDQITYLSFDIEQKLIEWDERQKDYLEFAGKKIKGLTVRKYLKPESSLRGVRNERRGNLFSIKNLLDKEISTLSTGEIRKVQLIKILYSKAQIIILDEPFEGLDLTSREELLNIIENITTKKNFILITHRLNEVPKNITHIMEVRDGRILKTGKLNETISTRHAELVSASSKPGRSKLTLDNRKIIVEMNNLNIEFDKKEVLKNINWQIREGENWALTGSNGSGKSTLINLIRGSIPQSFTEDVKVFNKKFGINFSVWEAKEKIGFLSSDLMRKYSKNITVFEVILSGFFDSIGLYKKPTGLQIKKAKQWTKKLNIQNLVEKN